MLSVSTILLLNGALLALFNEIIFVESSSNNIFLLNSVVIPIEADLLAPPSPLPD
jgi:hypothetical protein